MSPAFFNQIVTGRRPVPVVKGATVERELGVSRRDLWPDTWWEIWPELQAPEVEQPVKVAPDPGAPARLRKPAVVSRRALATASEMPCDKSSPTRLICGDRRTRDRDGDPVEERRTLVRNIERAIAGATGSRER